MRRFSLKQASVRTAKHKPKVDAILLRPGIELDVEAALHAYACD
jgi:hypothetical protein